MKSSTADKSHVFSTWDTGIHGCRVRRGQGKGRGGNVGCCERGPPSQGAGFSQSCVSPLRCFPSHGVKVLQLRSASACWKERVSLREMWLPNLRLFYMADTGCLDMWLVTPWVLTARSLKMQNNQSLKEAPC